MAKIFPVRTAKTPGLTRRKAALLAALRIPTDIVRASCVVQYLTCGKPNCRCARGRKHGPFNYLVQCLGTGKMRKFLLKTEGQQCQAQAAVSAYVQFQEALEELSQINTELLRRGERLSRPKL